MIKIRLARGGRIHKPVYTIVAADARSPRDGKFLEKLGQYNPNSENVLVDVKVDKIQTWLSKGAVLSDTVNSLLKKNNIQTLVYIPPFHPSLYQHILDTKKEQFDYLTTLFNESFNFYDFNMTIEELDPIFSDSHHLKVPKGGDLIDIMLLEVGK